MLRPSAGLLALLLCLVATASASRAGGPPLYTSFDAGLQHDFVEGMASYAAGDYRRAEGMFRRILDKNPRLTRVRLELARILFMEKRDEQADYQFRLAAAANPAAKVARNIVRFREAIRARRSWRFNLDVGLAPDTNINSATVKDSVDIYGLPFQLDPSARAKSGTGFFAGGDASVRLRRLGKMPIYVEVYGQWTQYRDLRFDDAYAGLQAGPEFGLAGGRLRTSVTGVERWYGRRPLVASFGGELEYEKLLGDAWAEGATLLLRHNEYHRRSDVDGWDGEVRITVDRPIGRTNVGFAYSTIERSLANDQAQAFWRVGTGVAVVREISWGLRPQLRIDVARQVNDGLLAPFAKLRRDWLLQTSFSLYKRDWDLHGFAPSLSLTITRNYSTVSLYDERRIRGEIRLTRAF